jgi:endonuclease I
MTYKSINTVIRNIVNDAKLVAESMLSEDGAEEVKILANPEAEQTPADIVAARYVRKGKCGCNNKAEVQKKIIDNA